MTVVNDPLVTARAVVKNWGDKRVDKIGKQSAYGGCAFRLWGVPTIIVTTWTDLQPVCGGLLKGNDLQFSSMSTSLLTGQTDIEQRCSCATKLEVSSRWRKVYCLACYYSHVGRRKL